MIQVPHDPNLDSTSNNAAVATSSSVAAHGLPTGGAEDHFAAGNGGQDQGSADDDQLSSEPHSVDIEPSAGPLFNCHFYRLRHPPLHMFMKNAAGVPMLTELARKLDVVAASLLQAHTPSWRRWLEIVVMTSPSSSSRSQIYLQLHPTRL